MTDLGTAPLDRSPPAPPMADRHADDQVVLLGARGDAVGSWPKGSVHHRRTPLHLGFSCHVVDVEGRVLLARRASTKQTWPGVWSNACCGHPRPGETLRDAVTRRLHDELGLQPRRMGLALPDFVYRATMADGRVEHELCPVVVAEVMGEPVPNPHEVEAVAWVSWDALRARASREPASLSPWVVAQIAELTALAASPAAWLDRQVGSGAASSGQVGLDRPPAAAAPTGDVWPGRARGAHADDPLAAVAGPVDRLLAHFLAARAAEMRALDPAVLELAGAVCGLVNAGGKRLRPAFVYWGHRAAGGTHDDGVFVAAAAVELLHAFALLHDDVMDRSARRRGRPAAQVALARLHRDRGLAGDEGWFGVSGAILAGDLCFVWADQLLEETPLPAGAVERARRVFTQLRSEVIAGQYLDLRLAHEAEARGAVTGEADPHGANACSLASEATARRVALLKSARYTSTRPLQLGAALAAGGRGKAAIEARLAALSCYGDAVGLAFQLRDDVLGLFGEPELTGKGCLDDLREGKRTLLMLRALRLATGADQRFLRASLGDGRLDHAAARRCRAIVAASGALASVEALITAQHDRALHALRGIDEPARGALTRLAGLATRRGR